MLCVCFLVCVCTWPMLKCQQLRINKELVLWCLTEPGAGTSPGFRGNHRILWRQHCGPEHIICTCLRHCVCRVLTVRHTLASGLTSSATTFNRLSSCTVLVKSDVSFTSRSRSLWISFWLDWNTNKIFIQNVVPQTAKPMSFIDAIYQSTEVTL